MKKVNFERISEAYSLYQYWFKKFNKYEFHSIEEMPFYYILNNIFSAFLVEIGLKALIASEDKQMVHEHQLDKLFNQLSCSNQNAIAESMKCELEDLKQNLKENAEQFEQWRYYYELKSASFDIEFMNNLLYVITELLKDINDKIKNDIKNYD